MGYTTKPEPQRQLQLDQQELQVERLYLERQEKYFRQYEFGEDPEIRACQSAADFALAKPEPQAKPDAQAQVVVENLYLQKNRMFSII